jgi:hypothetical protein
MVASRSMMTGPPSPPGAESPASAQARSRAAARAARIAASARGPPAASVLTSRDTTGSDATGPARAGCSRSTAISARQSPPSASAAARSATILPGSCTARGARHGSRAADRPRLSPVTRSVSHSRTAPAWDTRPRPSADTVTLLLRALFCIWKVPSAGNGQDLRQALSFQAKGTFSFQIVSPANSRRKPEVSPAYEPSRVGPPVPDCS